MYLYNIKRIQVNYQSTMHTFRITSQRNAGGKAMGGLRGSSKVGTSAVNRRAQSRRAYGGNFFFNMPNPAPGPSPDPTPAPATGSNLVQGTYLVTWDNGDNASIPPNVIEASGTADLDYSTMISYDSSSGTVEFIWHSTRNLYVQSASDSLESIMSFSVKSDNAQGYDVIYNDQTNGSVVPLPSGLPLDDKFYLYSLGTDGTTKNYVYYNVADTLNPTSLVLGEPTGVDQANYSKAEFKVNYNTIGLYYSGTSIPVKYYSVASSSDPNFATFPLSDTSIMYATVNYGTVASTQNAADLDPLVTGDGSRPDYDTKVFGDLSFAFLPTSLSDATSEASMGVLYKEKIDE